MSKSNIVVLAIFLLTGVLSFSSVSISGKLLPSRSQLKQQYIDSLSQRQGSQIVRLPLHNGRTVQLTIQYLTTGKGIRTELTSPNRVCVTFDRWKVAFAALAIDAMVLCSRYGFCQQVEGYVAALRSATSDGRIILVEEYLERENFSGKAWRSMKRWKDAAYKTQWRNMYDRYVMTFQLHEIAHAALSHRPTPSLKTLMSNEGEADGFARYVANLTGLSTSPSISVLIDRLRVDQSRNMPVPGACRIEALSMPLSDWAAKHAPRDNKLTRKLRLPQRLARNDDVNYAFPLPRPKASFCENYAAAFVRGLKRASRLVSRDTALRSRDVPGGACR